MEEGLFHLVDKVIIVVYFAVFVVVFVTTFRQLRGGKNLDDTHRLQ